MGFGTESDKSDDQAPRDRKIRRILIQLLALQLVWVALLAGLTAGFHVVWTHQWRLFGRQERGIGPFTNEQLGVAAQVVPSTVIAIFVFAVGVAFVVAQVVPQARGTRAVEQLRDTWRLNLVISPAPPLVVGSAVLVASRDSSELAGALLALSVAYVAVALPLLVSILIDATDPAEFRSLLQKQGRKLTETAGEKIKKLPYPESGHILPPICQLKPLELPFHKRWWWIDQWRWKKIQRSTDKTYDLLRTLRGWVRTSATTGDSRELFEALEGTLGLAADYSRNVMHVAHLAGSVPSIYWSHVHTMIERSPMFDAIMDGTSRAADKTTADKTTAPLPQFRQATAPWAPKLLIRWCPHGDAGGTQNGGNGESGADYQHLPATWFANEIGRTIVRAVESSLAGHGLLDRDVTRLLNTLQNAIIIFSGSQAPKMTRDQSGKYSVARYWSAGVGIHYLVEVGLGVKRCTTEQIEWFHDPFLRLIWLHHHFRRIAGSPQVDGLTSEQLNALSVGACSGALRVGEAIIHARRRELRRSLDDELADLRRIVRAGLPDNPSLELRYNEVHNAIWLASDEAGPLASTDDREIRHCDRDVVEKLLTTLRRSSHRLPPSSSNGSAGSRYPAFQP